MNPIRVTRIVSGGQTGVDRGALEAAIELGIDHGGWCPKGRRAEDGIIPERYRVVETESAEYAPRTERNVADSDATLLICWEPPTGGTALTVQLAQELMKPYRIVDPEHPAAASETRQWLVAHAIRVLNVAGPRESNRPGASEQTKRFLLEVLRPTPTQHECTDRPAVFER
jgi:hypothetical protein